VALSARSYDILIGSALAAEAGTLLAGRFPGARAAIVTDRTVAGLHLPALEGALQAVGLHLGSVVVPAGEASKGFTELARLCERLLELGVERGDLVIALGGGVIGDLAGFAASVLRRGVRLVQMPTTLLAQVDSSIGGKTGINTPQGKNLIGTFHQPSLVLADTDLLATLPERERRAGYAEIAKYALLGDEPFFGWLEDNRDAVLSGKGPALAKAVEISCKAKAGLVARDETETGERALLNLGHTFGHALEAAAGYSGRLLHGEAVAIGMVLAFLLSEEKGFAPAGTALRVEGHLKSAGLPTRIADIFGQDRPEAARLIRLMAQDKKVRSGEPTLSLARGIGKAFISRDAGWGELEAFLARQVS
jgi:3-dehydroquinate synthase